DDCSGTIANGEGKFCTITNDDGKASITIVKHSVGADGKFTFNVTGQDAVDLTTANGWATTTLAVDGGNYNVIETGPTGWTLSGVSCVYDNQSIGSSVINGESVTVSPGNDVTCTFTNTASGADLSVTKSADNGSPEVNQNVTYTVTAHNAGPAS